MVELIDGVVNEVPVPRLVPPVAAANQFNVEPALPEAIKETVPVPHLEAGVVEFNTGISLTIIVNVTSVPGQPFNVGVIETVEVPAAEGVNAEILPVPEAANPIAVFVFVQAYVEDGLLPVNEMAAITEPTQAVLFPGFVAVGTGLIVAITAVLADVQPFEVTSA